MHIHISQTSLTGWQEESGGTRVLVSEYSYQKLDGGKSLGEQGCLFLSTVIKNWMAGRVWGNKGALSTKLALDIAIVGSSCNQLCCSQLRVGSRPVVQLH